LLHYVGYPQNDYHWAGIINEKNLAMSLGLFHQKSQIIFTMIFELIFDPQGFNEVRIDYYTMSFYLNLKSNILDRVLE
jgi:hypothetical protein